MLEYSSPGAFLPTRLGRDTTSYLFALQDVVAALLDLAPDDAVVARARRAVVRVPSFAVLKYGTTTHNRTYIQIAILLISNHLPWYTGTAAVCVPVCNIKCTFSYEYMNSCSALIPCRSHA